MGEHRMAGWWEWTRVEKRREGESLEWDSENVSASWGRVGWVSECVVGELWCGVFFFFFHFFTVHCLVSGESRKTPFCDVMRKVWVMEMLYSVDLDGYEEEVGGKKRSPLFWNAFKNVLFCVTGLGNGPFFVKVWHQWDDGWRTG